MKLVALIGKAGSGKSTILNKVIEKYPGKFNKIISCTNRPPRENERDKIDYYFLTTTQFIKKENSGKMLETASFNNWNYGTELSSLSKDKINIGVFNPTGIYNILKRKDIDLDLDVYYIQASDKDRLLRQLTREENPNVEEIVRRYQADNEDFSNIDLIDYTILYNNCGIQLDAAVTLIGQIY